MTSAAYCCAASFFFCLFCRKKKPQMTSMKTAADIRRAYEWRLEGMMVRE